LGFWRDLSCFALSHPSCAIHRFILKPCVFSKSCLTKAFCDAPPQPDAVSDSFDFFPRWRLINAIYFISGTFACGDDSIPRPVSGILSQIKIFRSKAKAINNNAIDKGGWLMKQMPRMFSILILVLIANAAPADPKGERIGFTVKTTPEDAQVRILNIGPKYRDGIALKPGRYRIEVTKAGYEKHLAWHQLTADAATYEIALKSLSAAPAPTPPTAAAPPPAAPAKRGAPGEHWRDPVTGMEFVSVPSGCYSMGSRDGEHDEQPVHNVCLDGFWLGRYEVTQRQWLQVMGDNPSRFPKGDNHPVENVSWDAAQDYIRRLNGKGSAKFRLPTEAEWEYACRSGGRNEIYSGHNSADTVAWHSEDWDQGHHAVGEKNANGLGLYDMSGNVWEWVQDAYSSDAYGQHAKNNPVNTSNQSNRVDRGGGWSSGANYSRCAYRDASAAEFSNGRLGLRLLRK
jgi:formylglycine-generating enzyme required for sulfatase activity